jgi:hypothetical protein
MNHATAGLVVALMAQLAGPAVALTCETYGIQGTYRSLQEAGVPFLLVHGTFSDLQPSTLPADHPPLVLASGVETWSARFTGHIGSATGFDQPISAQVTLILPNYSGIGGTDTAVAVEWLPDKAGLVWLQEAASGYQLTAYPCQTLIDTDPESITPALSCLRGGYCPKQ